MSKKVAKSRKSKAKSGQKLEILKIEGDWGDAVAKSFKKKRPAAGWPKK